jgi:hypothetical protein
MRRSEAALSGLPLMAFVGLLFAAVLAPLGAAPAQADSPAFNTRPAASGDYVGSPDLRKRALAALFAKFPKPPLVSEVDIEPDSIAVTTQNADAGYLGDQWTVSRLKILVFDQDNVDGPHPAESDGARAPLRVLHVTGVPRQRKKSCAASTLPFLVTGIDPGNRRHVRHQSLECGVRLTSCIHRYGRSPD